MLKKYLPYAVDKEELQVINSLIESLLYLKQEALREDQAFIAYAIEDAILAVKQDRSDKFVPQQFQNAL